MADINIQPGTEQVIKITEQSEQVIKITLPREEKVTIISELRQGPQGPQGPAGPPGDDGIGSTTYVHTQSMASTTWTINHNLEKFPSVTVVDSSNRLVFAMVEYIDENNLIVSVTAPFAGLAYLN